MNDQIQPNLSSDVQIIPSSKPSVVIIFDPSSTKSIGNPPPFTAAGEIFGFYAANDQKRAKNSVSNRKQLRISMNRKHKGWYGDFQTIAARSDDCTT